MSLYSKDRYNEIDANIRRLRAISPNVSGRKVAEVLKLDHGFVCKRLNKIAREDTKIVLETTLEKDIGGIQAFINIILPELTKIVFSDVAEDKDKIAAAKALISGKLSILDKKFDAGIFERQLGKLKNENKINPNDMKLIMEAVNYATERGKPTEDNSK